MFINIEYLNNNNKYKLFALSYFIKELKNISIVGNTLNK